LEIDEIYDFESEPYYREEERVDIYYVHCAMEAERGLKNPICKETFTPSEGPKRP
jgi:hypothetical protein